MARLMQVLGLVRELAITAYIARIGIVLASKLPRPLPQSPAQLEALVRRVSVLNGYPNDEAALNAIATAILHLPMDKGTGVNTHAKDAYFAALLRRSVTNQVAFQIVDAKRAAKMAATNVQTA